MYTMPVVLASNLFLAVSMQESSCDPFAINESEQAYGIAQIRAPALQDLNGRYRTDYRLEDFLGNVPLSLWAFWSYGRLYGAVTAEEFVRIWNGGPRGPSKQATQAYWKGVRSNLIRLGIPEDQV